MQTRRVFRSWLCEECMARLSRTGTTEDAPIKLHRSSQRVMNDEISMMQIGHFAVDLPHLVQDANGDIYCPRCGFLYEHPPSPKILNDPRQPKVISGLKSLECNRFRSWRDLKPPHTVHTIIALDNKSFIFPDENKKGKAYRVPLDQREALAEQTLAAPRFARPDSAVAESIKLSELTWHFCPEARRAFLSRPQIWRDPRSARAFYHCPLCAEAGRDEWHLMAQDYRHRVCPTAGQECVQDASADAEALGETHVARARDRPANELYDALEAQDHGVEVDEEPYFYDPIYAGARSRRNRGVSVDPLENPESWENKLPSQPLVNGGLSNVSRAEDVTLHYCAASGRTFMARELVWTDRANKNRKYFYCVICEKWHYLTQEGLKPKGYLQQAIKTAIVAVSRERQRIGAIPPSMSQVQEYCSGWWPSKTEPFVATNGHFNVDLALNPATVRDVILSLEVKGQLYTRKSLLDGSRRVIGGESWQRGACYGSGNIHTYILRRVEREIPDAPKLYYDVNYNTGASYQDLCDPKKKSKQTVSIPVLREMPRGDTDFLADYKEWCRKMLLEASTPRPAPTKDEPGRGLEARIIELKKHYRPEHPETWVLDGPSPSYYSPEIIGQEFTLFDGTLAEAVDGLLTKVLAKLHRKQHR